MALIGLQMIERIYIGPQRGALLNPSALNSSSEVDDRVLLTPAISMFARSCLRALLSLHAAFAGCGHGQAGAVEAHLRAPGTLSSQAEFKASHFTGLEPAARP